jgi:hypothetical protein
VHLVEEVLLRKEVTARTETIHDTVRRDTLEIEQPSNLPLVFQAGPKPAEKSGDETQAIGTKTRYRRSEIRRASRSARDKSTAGGPKDAAPLPAVMS